MATPFTSVERAKIREYLGWSARFHQFDSALEGSMAAIDSEPDDSTHDRIALHLGKLDTLVANIEGAYGRLKAMKVGSIDLPGQTEIAMLRSEGARVANIIASTLGVGIRHNVFSAGANRSFASFDGMTGGDNQFRQG